MVKNQIAEAVRAAVGEDALALLSVMKTGAVSEFKIMKSAKKEIQAVRNLLYKLHSLNLANYSRVKDNKKGIYVSYWTLNIEHAKELYRRMQREKLEKFRERLKAETSDSCFFICPAACVRLEFASAQQNGFRCQECGRLMQQDDNTRTIGLLKEKIREMETAA